MFANYKLILILLVFILKINTSKTNRFKIVIISDDLQNNRTLSSIEGLKSANGNFDTEIIELSSGMNDGQLCEKLFATSIQSQSVYYYRLPIFGLDLSESITGKIMARKMGIPSLRAGTWAQAQQDNLAWKNLNEIEENLYVSVLTPEATILQLIKDLSEQFQLKHIVIIYDQTFKKAIGGHVFKNLKHKEIYWSSMINNKTIEKTLDDLKYNYQYGETFFILGSISMLNRLVQMAHHRSMLRGQRKWYFISKEKGRFQCDNCNDVKVFLSQPIKSHLHHYEYDTPENLTSDIHHIVDNYFYYDLSRFYAETIDHMLQSTRQLLSNEITYPSCGKHLNEPQLNERRNLNLYETLATRFMYGLFGQFIFDHNAKLNYQELSMRINEIEFQMGKVKQVKKVAEWEFEGQFGRLYFTSPQERKEQDGLPHYEIITIVEAPFVMIKDDNQTTGNDRFYGYCIDLLKEIVNSSDFKFDYTLRVVDDAMYGHKNENGEWTGLIGELHRKKADIALAPISVMAEREIVVDFTVPYYDLVGITILMKKTTTKSHLFKFLTVLETKVWLCILAAYFFTSFLMYLFDRLSPYSFHNNREKYKNDEEQREFTLKECLWFCMTSLTPQGGGEAPRNLSGRLVAATWWLFGFIIIASYTANLAAFLTVSRLDSPIENLDDLARQYKIKYAPQSGTATSTYFERMAGIEEKFYEIWKDMSLNDSLSDDERAKLAVWDYPVSDKYTKIWSQIIEAGMPATFAEAIERVKKSDTAGESFAFIAESTLVKYAVMTNCELQSVGNEFSRKPIALAVQQNSDLKDKLSSAILKLLNQRRLENLKESWWNNNDAVKKECQDSRRQSDGISIKNIGGVFIVIFIGVILACITLVIEYWYFKKKESKVITINEGKKSKHFGNSAVPDLSADFNINQERMMRQLRSTRNFNNFVHHHY
ncbi:glutamate receptor [Dermatophagoides farinae]|uniref:Glutamate receptor n=1 Tax=Dermatophagoides farinae TaxID=6954 RepID=A0A9D4P2P2_DERFA|nr:ionotropic receptor 25a-like [Dermatophagoides farinae]KAH7642522.1 glutamate receptor [Dermatophagoides farinae]